MIVVWPTLCSALESILRALTITLPVLGETLRHSACGAFVSVPHGLVAEALVSTLDVVPVASPIALRIIIHALRPAFVSPKGTLSFRLGIALVESVPAVDVPALAEVGAAGGCGVVAAADTQGV